MKQTNARTVYCLAFLHFFWPTLERTFNCVACALTICSFRRQHICREIWEAVCRTLKTVLSLLHHATNLTLNYMQKAAYTPSDAEGNLPATTTVIPGEFVSSRKLQTLQLWMGAKGKFHLHPDFQGRHPLKQKTVFWGWKPKTFIDVYTCTLRAIAFLYIDHTVSVKPIDCLHLMAKEVPESLMSDNQDPSRWIDYSFGVLVFLVSWLSNHFQISTVKWRLLEPQKAALMSALVGQNEIEKRIFAAITFVASQVQLGCSIWE